MADEERELLLRVTVETDDVAPEIARLQRQLKAADQAVAKSSGEATRAQDAATAATGRRKKATEDLAKTTAAQSQADRKQVEDAIRLLQQHQQQLVVYRAAQAEYQRAAAAAEAANAAQQARFRAGAIRRITPVDVPEAPQRPAPPSGLRFKPTPVNQAAAAAEAKAIVDAEEAQNRATAIEVAKQRTARKKPAVPKALTGTSLESQDSDELLAQLAAKKPERQRVARTQAQQISASEKRAADAQQRAVQAVVGANDQRAAVANKAASEQNPAPAPAIDQKPPGQQSIDWSEVTRSQIARNKEYWAEQERQGKAAQAEIARAARQAQIDAESGIADSAEPVFRSRATGRLPGTAEKLPNVDQLGLNRATAYDNPADYVADYTSSSHAEPNAADRKLNIIEQIRRFYDRTAAKRGQPLSIKALADARGDFPDKLKITEELRKLVTSGQAELVRKIGESDHTENAAGHAFRLPDGSGSADRFRIPQLGGNSMLSAAQRAAIAIARRGEPVNQERLRAAIPEHILPPVSTFRQPSEMNTLEQQRAYADRLQAAQELRIAEESKDLREYIADLQDEAKRSKQNGRPAKQVEAPDGQLTQLYLGAQMAEDAQYDTFGGQSQVRQGALGSPQVKAERRRQSGLQKKIIADYQARRAANAGTPPPPPAPLPAAPAQIETSTAPDLKQRIREYFELARYEFNQLNPDNTNNIVDRDYKQLRGDRDQLGASSAEELDQALRELISDPQSGFSGGLQGRFKNDTRTAQQKAAERLRIGRKQVDRINFHFPSDDLPELSAPGQQRKAEIDAQVAQRLQEIAAPPQEQAPAAPAVTAQPETARRVRTEAEQREINNRGVTHGSYRGEHIAADILDYNREDRTFSGRAYVPGFVTNHEDDDSVYIGSRRTDKGLRYHTGPDADSTAPALEARSVKELLTKLAKHFDINGTATISDEVGDAYGRPTQSKNMSQTFDVGTPQRVAPTVEQQQQAYVKRQQEQAGEYNPYLELSNEPTLFGLSDREQAYHDKPFRTNEDGEYDRPQPALPSSAPPPLPGERALPGLGTDRLPGTDYSFEREANLRKQFESRLDQIQSEQQTEVADEHVKAVLEHLASTSGADSDFDFMESSDAVNPAPESGQVNPASNEWLANLLAEADRFKNTTPQAAGGGGTPPIQPPPAPPTPSPSEEPEPSRIGAETITADEFARQERQRALAARPPRERRADESTVDPDGVRRGPTGRVIPDAETNTERAARKKKERDDRYETKRRQIAAEKRAAKAAITPAPAPEPVPVPEPEPEPTPEITPEPVVVEQVKKAVKARVKKKVAVAEKAADKAIQEAVQEAVAELPAATQPKPKAAPRRRSVTPADPEVTSTNPYSSIERLDNKPQGIEDILSEFYRGGGLPGGGEPPHDDYDYYFGDDQGPRAIGPGAQPRQLGTSEANFGAIRQFFQKIMDTPRRVRTPIAQEPRRRQTRQRQDAIRKDERRVAREGREAAVVRAREERSLGQQMQQLFSNFQLPNAGTAYEEPDFDSRFNEILPGERVGEFMERLRYQARKQVQPYQSGSYRQPQLEGQQLRALPAAPARGPIPIERNRRTGATPFPRVSGDASELDDAVNAEYRAFHGLDPELLAIEGPSGSSRKRGGSRAGGGKVRADVDCEALHRSIDRCLKSYRGKITVDADGKGTAKGLSGGGFTEDPETIKARREAAENDKAHSQENRAFSKEVRDTTKETITANRDTAKIVRDTAKDTRQHNRLLNDDVRKRAQADGIADLAHAETLRGYERQSAAERLEQARANAEAARHRARGAQLSVDSGGFGGGGTDRGVRRPRGFFQRVGFAFGQLGRDLVQTPEPVKRFLQEARRPQFARLPIDPNSSGRQSGFVRRQEFDKENLPFSAAFPFMTSFNPTRRVEPFTERISRSFYSASNDSLGGLNPFRKVEKEGKEAFSAVPFKRFFTDFRNEFTKSGRLAEGVFSGIKRSIKGAFSGGSGGEAGGGFLKTASGALSNFADNLAASFQGVGKTLFSFRGIIILVLAALGPLVALLGSVAGGALALANVFAQLVSVAFALPGILSAAAAGVAALVVAFKPLSGILSAYSAQQKAVAEQTASGVPATQSALRAQQDLNRARRDAKRDLEDMATALGRVKLNETGAAISVQQSYQSYLEALANPNATVLDQQAAYQAYQEAKANQQDVKTKDTRLQQDYNADGSVKNAAKYGDDNVRKQQDAAATVAAGGSSTAATSTKTLNAELAKAGPETKKFALGLAAIFLDANSPWKKTQKAVAEAVFTPLVPELGNIKKLLDPIGKILEAAGGALGTFFAKAVELFSSPAFTSFFADLADQIGGKDGKSGLITVFGDAALSIIDAFRNIIEAAAPFTDYVAGAIKGLASAFDGWAEKGNKSGSLRNFLVTQVIPTMQQVGDIIGGLFTAFKNLFTGSNDFTRLFLTDLDTVVQTFADWSKSAADPNSGFRKFLADTYPLLKQLGTTLVDVVQYFFKLAADPKNITEAKKILQAISENILPAIYHFFTELASTGIVSKSAELIGKVADAIALILAHGGGTAFKVLLVFIDWLVEALDFFVRFPGVATTIGTIAVALGALVGAALLLKIPGIGALLRFFKFLITNKNSLSTIMEAVGGFFSKVNQKFNPFATKTGSSEGSSASESATAKTEVGWLEKISGQLGVMTGLLRNIEACVCRKTPCTCTEGVGADSAERAAASGLETAAIELQVAARALMGAATQMSILGATAPRALTAAAETRVITAGGGASRAVTAGETAAAEEAGAASKTGFLGRAGSFLGKAGRVGGKVVRGATLAYLGYELLKPLFTKKTADQQSQSYIDKVGGPSTFGFAGLAALPFITSGISKATGGQSIISKLLGGNKLSSVLTGANRADASSRGTFNVSDVDADGYARTVKAPNFAQRLIKNITGVGARSAEGTAVREGGTLAKLLRLGKLGGSADPFTLPGIVLGATTDALAPPGTAAHKSTAAELGRAGGAILTGAGTGFQIGGAIGGPPGAIIGAAVGAVSGGAYSLYKDKDLRTKVSNGLDTPLGALANPGAALINQAGKFLSQRDKGGKGDTRVERIWDGAYEGFMKAIGSPVASFFRGLIGNVGGFFSKTLPNFFRTHLIQPVTNFFTKTLPSLPLRLLDGFVAVTGFLIGFFTEGLPRLVGKGFQAAIRFTRQYFINPVRTFITKDIPEFFTETIPKWFRESRHWLGVHVVQPVRAFVNGIPGFFTQTIPKWFSSAGHWFHAHVATPVADFVTKTIPEFFTETIPKWFAAAPQYISRHIIAPLTHFFTSTLPRFFTEDIPNAIASIPGFLYDHVVKPVIDFFSAIPDAIGDFFTGGWDAITELAHKIFSRETGVFDKYKQKGADVGKQSGGLIEGTYDGRVDTRLVPLTIGEWVTRRRVTEKPMGKQLLGDLNEERFDPADFYAALDGVTRNATVSVVTPKMSLVGATAASTTINNDAGMNFGDVHIHNPIREKSDLSMRRTLHKLAYRGGRGR